MNAHTSRHNVQTLKNRCTLLAAFLLTAAACYLLAAPPL
jgi:hypothetical protein